MTLSAWPMVCTGMYCICGPISRQEFPLRQLSLRKNWTALASIHGELILHCSIKTNRYYPIHFITVMLARTACSLRRSSVCLAKPYSTIRVSNSCRSIPCINCWRWSSRNPLSLILQKHLLQYPIFSTTG